MALAGPARAQAPAGEPAAAGAEDPQARGQRLFEEGSAAYNLGRFADAIARFEEAYALLRASSLLYNLGQAYAKAYELDRDVARLRQARLLFTNFVKIREGTGEPIADARERVAAIEAQLAELERAAAANAKVEPPPAASPPPAPAPAPAPRRPYRPGGPGYAGIGLLAGGALAGAGLAVTGFVSAGRLADQRAAEGSQVPLSLARSDEYAAHERKASALAWAGVGVGAGLMLVGAVLLIVDARRGHRPARRAAAPRVVGPALAWHF